MQLLTCTILALDYRLEVTNFAAIRVEYVPDIDSLSVVAAYQNVATFRLYPQLQRVARIAGNYLQLE